MASFGSYNTTDSTTGQVPLLANAAPVVLGPLQTTREQILTGAISTDQSGTLLIQQSFDAGIYWFTTSTIAVVGGTDQTWKVDVLAPWLRLMYTNGSTNQTYMRLFSRLYATGW